MSRGALTEAEMNKICDEESRYDFYKKHSDPSMGDITLMKSRTSDEVICCKEYIKNSREQFTQAIFEAQARLRLNHKYLIEMKNYSTRVKNDFCSTFYSIKLFYEYQMNNLQKETRHRRDKGQDFSSLELTHLLYNIVEVGAYLQEQSRAHGDIRPSSIAVLHEGNSYKLIDRADSTVGSLQYQQSLIFSGKDLYLPPALFLALKKNTIKVNHNEYKTDVFSFGLCLLEAGLKKPVSSIYSESGFNRQELDRLMAEFSKKYQDNPMLVTTLSKMIAVEELERPDFKQILKAIPSYAEVLEYFESEDQYDEPFTSNNYGQDYPGQYYDPNHPPHYGGYPDQHQYGAHPQNPAYGYGANPQFAPQPNHPQYPQYGQPAAPQGVPQYGAQNQMVSSNPLGFNAPNNQGAFSQPAYGQISNLVQSYPQAQQPQYIQPGQGNQLNGIQPQLNQPLGAQSYGQPQPSYVQQPVNGYSNQPQAAAAYGQPASNPYTTGNSYNQYGATSLPQSSPSTANVSYAAPSSEDGEIKVINGVRYREVKETRNEVNELGQNVRKIIVKLQPVDENVKMGAALGAPVSAGYSVNQGPSYVNAPAGYSRPVQAPGQPVYGAGQVIYR